MHTYTLSTLPGRTMRPLLLLATSFMLLFALSFASNAQSVAGFDDSWPMPDGPVSKVQKVGNIIYTAGSFKAWAYQNSYGTSVNMTTGVTDTSFAHPDAIVRVAIPDGAGGWYIGGGFSFINGVLRRGLARLNADGSLHSFDVHLNGEVLCMSLQGNKLYIGGSFTTVGEGNRSFLACIDTSTGLPTPFSFNLDNYVSVMTFHGNTIYFSGGFQHISNLSRHFVAAADVVTGQIKPWNPNASDYINAMIVHGANVYLGGNFYDVHNQLRKHLAAVDTVAGNLTSWNPNPDSFIHTMVLSGNELYFAGDFSHVAGQARNRMASIDLSTGALSSFNPGVDGAVDKLSVNGSTLYIGGQFRVIGGKQRSFLAAVDIPSGITTGWDPHAFDNVGCIGVGVNSVYVGGSFKAIGGMRRNGLAGLNSSTGALTTFNPGVASVNMFSGITCFDISGNTMYLGGYFDSVGGQPRHGMAAVHLNSGAVKPWDPNPSDLVRVLVVSGSRVYAGGTFYNIGGQTRPKIAALDTISGLSTSFNAVALGSYVSSIVPFGGHLYVGGAFMGMGGQTRYSIACIDTTTGLATSWNPGDVSNSTYSLFRNNNVLYVGGAFQVAGQFRAGAAAFDLTTGAIKSWSPQCLTPATYNATINTMAFSGDRVYLGGSFEAMQYNNYTITSRNLCAVDTITGHNMLFVTNILGEVHSITAGNNRIFVAGDMTEVDYNLTQRYFMPMRDTTRSLSIAAYGNAVCRGSAMPMLISVAGSFNNNNTFYLERSNSSGSFASSVYIPYNSGFGLRNITIPANTPAGVYRIRIRSTSPVLISADNGFDIAVSSLPQGGSIAPSNPPTLCPPQTVGLSTTNTTSGISYQWLRDGFPLTGATNSSYTAPITGSYVVQYINGACSRKSQPVTINPGNCIPSIAIGSSSPDTICAGATVNFISVVTLGGAAPQYQWLKNGVPIPGATANTLSINTLLSNEPISCIVYNGGGYDTSNNMSFTVRSEFSGAITGNVCNGDTLRLSSNWALTQIDWKLNGQPLKTILPGWQSNAATISASGQLNAPADIFRSASGDLYVSDQLNNRVVKYVPGSGVPLVVAGGNGQGNALNQLNKPAGIFVDGVGNLYIADQLNHRVIEYSPGALTGQVVAGGNGVGSTLSKLRNPQAVCVSATGDVYVADGLNHRIVKWAPGTTAGVVVAGGNGAGAAANQLNYPADLLFDGSGNLIVSDQNNHRVVSFAPSAQYGSVIAGGNGAGDNNTQLNKPSKISLSQVNDLLIADQANNRIVIWANGASSGSVVAGGGSPGNTANKFNRPSSLVFAGPDTIIVADMNNDRLQRFCYGMDSRLIPSVAGSYSAAVVNTDGCAGNSGTTAVIGTGVVPNTATSTIEQADGTSYSYIAGGCKQIATLADNTGGSAPGLTTVNVIKDQSVQLFNGKPYLQRHFELLPATGTPGTVTLYITQAEFNAYNNYITTNNLSFPLLPANSTNTAGIANIAVTRFNGTPNSDTTGPGGKYSGANKIFIPNAAIAKTFLGSGIWKLQFNTSLRGGFFIHSGNVALKSPFTEGIMAISEDGFLLEAFPNPASTHLTISIDGVISGNAQIELLDVTGKLLLVNPVRTALTTFDIGNYAEGVYLLHYRDDKRNKTVKISKLN